MRFNTKARLDTSRTSDRGRGRSGGAGAGLPIPGGLAGGGIGGMVVAVLVVLAFTFLGGDGAGTTYDDDRMGDSDRYAECRTGANANESADCARIAVENSLYDYWSDTLPAQSDTRFAAAQLRTFSGGVSTACGEASSAVGPFYCPVDSTIYLDSTFFAEVLERQLGGPSGAFVEPYVLAHEYGHHIQNLLGTMGRVKTQQGPRSDAVRLELQADCYAGMWARSATTTEDADGNVLISDLTQADVQEAIAAAQAVGDDRIQQQSGGRVDSEQWTHGSAAQRVAWFRTGYGSGTLDACDTFAADAL